MDHPSKEAITLIHSLLHPAPAPSFKPGPAAMIAGPKSAVRRCNTAWRRAFKAYMENNDDGSEYCAAEEASEAFRNAMPLLDSYSGVRDFIACAAHGILIGAIPRERGGQLLYAAQVAMAALQREPKPPQAAPERPQT